MHFNLLTLILIIASSTLGYAAKHLKEKSWGKAILSDIDDIVDHMSEASSPQSDGETSVTPAERKKTIHIAEIKALELSKRVFRHFFGTEAAADGKRQFAANGGQQCARLAE
jgi:hypothetical protein